MLNLKYLNFFIINYKFLKKMFFGLILNVILNFLLKKKKYFKIVLKLNYLKYIFKKNYLNYFKNIFLIKDTKTVC